MPDEFIPPQPEFTSMERLRARLLAGVTSLDAVYDFEEACNAAAKQIGVDNPNYESLVEVLYQDLAETSFNLENALRLADRRVKLCSPSPVCPACGTEQVQYAEEFFNHKLGDGE